MSVTLFTTQNPDPQVVIVKDVADLKATEGTFIRAEVTEGTWIFYTNSQYNEAGGSHQNHVILQAKDGIRNISCHNGSMRFVPAQTEGVVLYEHAFYGGREKWVQDHNDDLNKLFPSGTGQGVSSAIVLSHDRTYQAFAKPYYEGLSAHLTPEKRYPIPRDMGIGNDRMQSIRPS